MMEENILSINISETTITAPNASVEKSLNEWREKLKQLKSLNERIELFKQYPALKKENVEEENPELEKIPQDLTNLIETKNDLKESILEDFEKINEEIKSGNNSNVLLSELQELSNKVGEFSKEYTWRDGSKKTRLDHIRNNIAELCYKKRTEEIENKKKEEQRYAYRVKSFKSREIKFLENILKHLPLAEMTDDDIFNKFKECYCCSTEFRFQVAYQVGPIDRINALSHAYRIEETHHPFLVLLKKMAEWKIDDKGVGSYLDDLGISNYFSEDIIQKLNYLYVLGRTFGVTHTIDITYVLYESVSTTPEQKEIKTLEVMLADKKVVEKFNNLITPPQKKLIEEFTLLDIENKPKFILSEIEDKLKNNELEKIMTRTENEYVLALSKEKIQKKLQDISTQLEKKSSFIIFLPELHEISDEIQSIYEVDGWAINDETKSILKKIKEQIINTLYAEKNAMEKEIKKIQAKFGEISLIDLYKILNKKKRLLKKYEEVKKNEIFENISEISFEDFNKDMNVLVEDIKHDEKTIRRYLEPITVTLHEMDNFVNNKKLPESADKKSYYNEKLQNLRALENNLKPIFLLNYYYPEGIKEYINAVDVYKMESLCVKRIILYQQLADYENEKDESRKIKRLNEFIWNLKEKTSHKLNPNRSCLEQTIDPELQIFWQVIEAEENFSSLLQDAKKKLQEESKTIVKNFKILLKGWKNDNGNESIDNSNSKSTDTTDKENTIIKSKPESTLSPLAKINLGKSNLIKEIKGKYKESLQSEKLYECVKNVIEGHKMYHHEETQKILGEETNPYLKFTLYTLSILIPPLLPFAIVHSYKTTGSPNIFKAMVKTASTCRMDNMIEETTFSAPAA